MPVWMDLRADSKKRKKPRSGAACGTSSQLQVSQMRSNYLGGVAGALGAVGAVVLGLVAPGVVGLAACRSRRRGYT